MPMALFLGFVGCALGICEYVDCDTHGSPQAECVVEYAPPNDGPVSIEIHTQTGHIVMPVWIEGDGPHWFVLDTGNQNTVFYAQLRETLELDVHLELSDDYDSLVPLDS